MSPERGFVPVDRHGVHQLAGEVRDGSRGDGVQHEEQKRDGEQRQVRIGQTQERPERPGLCLPRSPVAPSPPPLFGTRVAVLLVDVVDVGVQLCPAEQRRRVRAVFRFASG